MRGAQYQQINCGEVKLLRKPTPHKPCNVCTFLYRDCPFICQVKSSELPAPWDLRHAASSPDILISEVRETRSFGTRVELHAAARLKAALDPSL